MNHCKSFEFTFTSSCGPNNCYPSFLTYKHFIYMHVDSLTALTLLLLFFNYLLNIGQCCSSTRADLLPTWSRQPPRTLPEHANIHLSHYHVLATNTADSWTALTLCTLIGLPKDKFYYPTTHKPDILQSTYTYS